jgi:aminoglycoside/choline kinase family phosphotransferase
MPNALPLDAASLTAAWLSAALGIEIPSFGVEAHYIGFIGETLRLNLGDSSIIAKLPTQNAERRAHFAAIGMYEREIRFYEHIAPRIELRTPACYFSAYDDASGLGVLLLEDFAPAKSGNRLDGCTPEEAGRAIIAIASLHAAWWQSPEIATMDWLNRHDPKSVSGRFLDTWDVFRSKDVPASSVKLGERLTQNIALLDALWDAPRTLIHRDYQLDNIFFIGEETAIIDWQLIAPGRGVFDVAMFLCWNSQPEFRRQHEMSLLQMYHTLLLAAGIDDYPFEQCLRDYRLSMLLCFMRVVPMLGSDLIEEEHLLTTLHTLLARATAAIIDLDVLAE